MIMIVPFAEEEFLIDCSEIHFTRVGECSQVVFDGSHCLMVVSNPTGELELLVSHCTGLWCWCPRTPLKHQQGVRRVSASRESQGVAQHWTGVCPRTPYQRQGGGANSQTENAGGQSSDSPLYQQLVIFLREVTEISLLYDQIVIPSHPILSVHI